MGLSGPVSRGALPSYLGNELIELRVLAHYWSRVYQTVQRRRLDPWHTQRIRGEAVSAVEKLREGCSAGSRLAQAPHSTTTNESPWLHGYYFAKPKPFPLQLPGGGLTFTVNSRAQLQAFYSEQ